MTVRGDTILMLHQHGIHVENKPFAVGVRIEHKQKYINEAMLHEYSQDERLIPARYQLTYTASNSKVYIHSVCVQVAMLFQVLAKKINWL